MYPIDIVIVKLINNKSQITNNKQITMTKIQNSKQPPAAVRTFWSLKIVIWKLFVIWDFLHF